MAMLGVTGAMGWPIGEVFRLKVTLHEVAARADVSIATVSRALNGLPVSKESLARVRRAANDLGYVANEAARALKSDRSLTMGLIFSDLRNTMGIELLDALSESIEDAGYSLLISTARGDDARYDRLLHRFLERRVDAMFCIRPHGESESLARYAATNTPVMAMFNASGAFADMPTIVPSFSDPGKALGHQLRDLGHKKIAIVRDGTSSPALVAISDSLKAQKLTVESFDLPTGGGLRDLAQDILAPKQRATAIVAPDPMVRRIASVCHAMKLSVPGDLSVVSVSDVSAERYHKDHALSSVMIDPHRVGRAAGSAMLAWLAGSPPGDKVRIQVASYAPRASVGSAPKRR